MVTTKELFVCDYCGKKDFPTYEDALEHETVLMPNIRDPVFTVGDRVSYKHLMGELEIIGIQDRRNPTSHDVQYMLRRVNPESHLSRNEFADVEEVLVSYKVIEAILARRGV